MIYLFVLVGLMACLKEAGYPDEIRFDENNEDVRKFVDTLIPALAQSLEHSLPDKKVAGTQIHKSSANRKYAQDFVIENRECFPLVTNSRLDVGIQDWFASDVTARYLADHPLKGKTPEDSLGPLASIVDFSCRCTNADELTQKYHTDLATRINEGIFSNPRLRQALNCQPSQTTKKTCTVSTQFRVQKTEELVSSESGQSQR